MADNPAMNTGDGHFRWIAFMGLPGEAPTCPCWSGALEELARTRLIVREPGSGTRETPDRILAGAAAEPARPLMVLDANVAMRGAVLGGAGPAVLSALTMREDLADGRVVEVPVAGVDLRRELRAVWARGRRLSGVARDLMRIAVRGGRGGRGEDRERREGDERGERGERKDGPVRAPGAGQPSES